MIEKTQLITVIVPVYKVEKYLHRCVESILSQTYKNIEILLIDDDSPDNCPEICDAYARDYSNIKSVHLKNSGIGVSGARNAGLDNATGDYITFIDSDDYVHKDLLKILITNLRSDPSVKMAMASCQKVTEDTKQFEQIEENNVSLLSDLEAFNLLIEDQNKSALWSKLFERTIFDQLRFPVDKHNEDMFLMP
uniref:glycosyltransferase family 2 protein n=1 Tax=Flavobacterium sp. TaxID=239 RepID=UPI00404AFC07